VLHFSTVEAHNRLHLRLLLWWLSRFLLATYGPTVSHAMAQLLAIEASDRCLLCLCPSRGFVPKCKLPASAGSHSFLEGIHSYFLVLDARVLMNCLAGTVNWFLIFPIASLVIVAPTVFAPWHAFSNYSKMLWIISDRLEPFPFGSVLSKNKFTALMQLRPEQSRSALTTS